MGARTMIMKELGTCISFFKCMEMKKMEACFMKDFREAMADYGFDAVEEKINMGLEMMGEEVHHEGIWLQHIRNGNDGKYVLDYKSNNEIKAPQNIMAANIQLYKSLLWHYVIWYINVPFIET